jgi:hypothetical protein
MASFTAVQSTNNDTLTDIYVLLDASVIENTVSGMEATFTANGVTVTLLGSGFSGSMPTSAWNIDFITAENASGTVWHISGLNGLHGDTLIDAIYNFNPGHRSIRRRRQPPWGDQPHG